MSGRILTTTLCLCILFAPRAQAQVRLALLPTIVEGELDATAASDFEDVLVENLSDLELMGSEELASSMGMTTAELRGCTTVDCLRRGFENASIDGVIRTTVQASLNMYALHIEILASDGQYITRVEDQCDLCTLSEAREALGRTAAALRREIPSSGVLRLSVTPSSASVTIDGEPALGSEVTLAPGTHQIQATAEGYIEQERRIEINLGSEEMVEIALERTTENPEDDGLGNLGISGVVLMAAGGLALAAGVALIVIDENCAGGRTDANGQCEFIYSTLGGGAAALAIGGAGLIAGLVLLVIDRLRSRNRGQPDVRGKITPSLALDHNGAPRIGASWTLNF